MTLRRFFDLGGRGVRMMKQLLAAQRRPKDDDGSVGGFPVNTFQQGSGA